MFVRKRGGSYQLIESYRDRGKPRQRVVYNLGPYETPEAALVAMEAELDELLAPALAAEARVETNREEWTKPRWKRGLDKWHGGELPALEEVIERARKALPHREYGENWPEPRTLDGVEYVEDFVGLNGDDLAEFIWDLRHLEELKAEARTLQEDAEPEAIVLRKQIEALRGLLDGAPAGVVSK